MRISDWSSDVCSSDLPQKKKIISRDRGYHGSGIMTGSLTGLATFHQHFDLPVEGVKHTVCPHWYRKAPAGMDEGTFVRYCADELEKMILAEGPDTVAAFIGEPLMGTGGIIVPPAGSWDAIRSEERRVGNECDRTCGSRWPHDQ